MVPGLKLGRFRLIKILPVASGLGGGSADAAAALRLIARANDGALSEPALTELAPQARLGRERLPDQPPRADLRPRREGRAGCGLPVLRRAARQSGTGAGHRGGLCRASCRPSDGSAAPCCRATGLPRRLRGAARLCDPARQRSRRTGGPARAGDQGGARRAGDAGRRAPCPTVRQRADLLCAIRERDRGAARRRAADSRVSRLVDRRERRLPPRTGGRRRTRWPRASAALASESGKMASASRAMAP